MTLVSYLFLFLELMGFSTDMLGNCKRCVECGLHTCASRYFGEGVLKCRGGPGLRRSR